MNPVAVATSVAEAIFLAVSPSGGQRMARRNALTAVKVNDVTALQRAEAAAAMTAMTTVTLPAPPALRAARR